MSNPLNLQSDYALDFANSMPDSGPDDNLGDSEDPVSRGASKIGQLDMFRSAPTSRPRRHPVVTGGTRGPIPFILTTPGAHEVP